MLARRGGPAATVCADVAMPKPQAAVPPPAICAGDVPTTLLGLRD